MPERIASTISGRQAAGRHFVFDASIQQEKAGLARLFDQLPVFAKAPWLDLRDHKDWWARGVDYILDGGIKVDFKVEKQKVRNCAAELIKADRPSLKPGWLLTSESHWIIHYFELTGEIVCLPTQGYRDFVLAQCLEGQMRDSVSAANFNRKNKTELLYLTWNALLPIKRAVTHIPGVFWSRVDGPELLGVLSESDDGLSVPVEWFTLWLQKGAIPVIPLDLQKYDIYKLLNILQPHDRARNSNSHFYLH